MALLLSLLLRERLSTHGLDLLLLDERSLVLSSLCGGLRLTRLLALLRLLRLLRLLTLVVHAC